MAYFDVLAQSSYMTVSKKAAKLFGLEAAAYLSVISNIASCVFKKKTYDDDGYFTLDRKYVEEETTLSLDKQIECDSLLKWSGIVEYRDPEDASVLRVNLQALASVLVEEDLSKVAVINKLPRDLKEESKRLAKKLSASMKAKSSAEKKAERDQAIRDTMKRICSEQTESELVREALSKWVDSIYDAGWFLNRDKISHFMGAVLSFTSSEAAQAEIATIAMQHSWVDPQYAISSYSRTHQIRQQSSAVSLGEQKKATRATVAKEAF